MDYQFEREWQNTLKKVESFGFDGATDLDTLLFLIGVQELGHGEKKFSKDEKMQLMHIAVCTLLSPFGYYKFTGRDQDDWPHFENTKPLPPLQAEEQQRLMKEAIVEYFQDY